MDKRATVPREERRAAEEAARLALEARIAAAKAEYRKTIDTIDAAYVDGVIDAQQHALYRRDAKEIFARGCA